MSKTKAKPVKAKIIAKAIKPTIGRVYYDYMAGKLGVQYQGKGEAYGPPEYIEHIMLRKVQTLIMPGPGGMMGFLVGEVTHNRPRSSAARTVSWNGRAFISGESGQVTEMSGCIVTQTHNGPTIQGYGCK